MSASEEKIPFLLSLQHELEERLSTPQGPKAFLASLNRDEIPLYVPFDYAGAQAELKDLRTVVGKAMSIMSNPHFKAEVRDVVLKVEQSGPLQPSSFMKTTRDTKLWKAKNLSMSPEEVHTTETYDSIVTYENKFICLLLDAISDRLEHILSTILPLLPSFESSVLDANLSYGPYGLINSLGHQRAIKGILDEGKGGKKDLGKLYKEAEALDKKVRLLRGSEFYQMVYDTNFNANVMPTNILLHDSLYAHCYRYYQKKLIGREERLLSEEAPYFNFAIISVLSFLVKSKNFSKRPSRPTFALNEEGMLNFGPLVYHRGDFLYTISVDNPHEAIKVEVLAYGRVASTFYILVRRRRDKTNKAQLAALVEELLEEDADAVTLLTAEDTFGDYRTAIPLTYNKKDNSQTIANLFASFCLLFKADCELYVDKCPVCGKGHTHLSGDARKCLDCNAKYRLIPSKGVIWISGFRRDQ